MRANDRKEKDDPRTATSNTDSDAANRTNPNTEKVDPKRALLRMDIAEPTQQ
jgi:hypothetical protein